MRWNLKSVVGSILLSVVLLTPSSGQDTYEQEGVERDKIIEEAKVILKKNGLDSAYVIKNPEGRLVLAGTFDNYDEFLFALMLMNVHFGFDKVAPIYDYRHAVIKKTTIELCFPYALRGKPCPYGRFTIEKKEGPKETRIKKYALVIGVKHFGDKEVIPEVPGADKDAEMFAKYLRERGYEVTVLLNQNATINNLKRAISDIYSKVKDGDDLVVFAASHGAPIDESGEVGIVLYDSMVDERSSRFCQAGKTVGRRNLHMDAALKMCTLVKNSFSIKEHIINTFADKRINLVVLLDACYSGDALRSYVGIGLPYEIATTKEYEKALKHAPNLSIMATAASGDRMSWGGSVSGEFLDRLISFVGGNPRVISLTDVTQDIHRSGRDRTIKTEPANPDMRKPSTNEQRVEHGVFTAFILEGLAKFNNSLAIAYERSKGDINYVSSRMCLTYNKGDYSKCPPGGQNPMLFRVRKEDYIFGR